jgi:hypothetical protein
MTAVRWKTSSKCYWNERILHSRADSYIHGTDLWIYTVLIYTALGVIEGVLVGGIYPEQYYMIKALFLNWHRSLAKAICKLNITGYRPVPYPFIAARYDHMNLSFNIKVWVCIQ